MIDLDLVLLLAFLIVVAGAAVAGLAAFGFSLVIVPPLLLAYEPATVTTLVIVLTLITRWVVLVDTWGDIRWRLILSMAPTAIVGTFIGALVLRHLDATYIELLASAVVVTTATLMLKGVALPGSQATAAPPVSGFFSGFLNTATGMAAPPVVLLFAARGFDPQIFRGTLTVFFYAVSAAGLAALIANDLVGRHELGVTFAMLPAALIGTIAGQRLSRRVSRYRFRQAVLLLLIATGAIGGAAAIRQIV
jgi:uncharacterized protein